MGALTNIINGDSFDTTVIRREKTSNGFKNVKDKVAKIEDPETGETLLKFKSDGLRVPKPDNEQFETLWYKDFFDRIFQSKSHTDFIEIHLKEIGDNAEGDFVQFDPGEEGETGNLELTGSTAQFQTHRDLEAEKTLDIFSSDDNQELYFLIGLATITMINLGGMYIIVSGLESSIVSGVKQGFQTVQSTAGSAQEATGLIPVFAFIGRNKISNVFENLKNLFTSDSQ